MADIYANSSHYSSLDRAIAAADTNDRIIVNADIPLRLGATLKATQQLIIRDEAVVTPSPGAHFTIKGIVIADPYHAWFPDIGVADLLFDPDEYTGTIYAGWMGFLPKSSGVQNRTAMASILLNQDTAGRGVVTVAAGYYNWESLILTQGSDGACSDHTGPGYTFTSASAAFTPSMTAIAITSRGDTCNGQLGVYQITSYVDPNTVVLDNDPTIAADETGMSFQAGIRQFASVGSETTVVFEGGTTLQVSPSNFRGSNSIFRVNTERTHWAIVGNGNVLIDGSSAMEYGFAVSTSAAGLPGGPGLISGFVFRNFTYDGVVIASVHDRVTVRDCDFIGCARCGVGIVGGTRIVVTNCRFYENGGSIYAAGGLNCESEAGWVVTDLQITNNMFDHCMDGIGIYVHRGQASGGGGKISNVLIANNHIDMAGTLVAITSDGACADHDCFTFTSASSSFDSTMVGRTLYIKNTGDGGHAIVQDIKVHAVLDANTIQLKTDPTDGTDETGIDFFIGGGGGGINVVGASGVTVDNVIISGNMIVGGDIGILGSPIGLSVGNYVDNVVLADNLVADFEGQAISLSGVNVFSVTGNVVRNTEGTGIRVLDTVASDLGVISGNAIYDCIDDGIDVRSTSTLVTGNVVSTVTDQEVLLTGAKGIAGEIIGDDGPVYAVSSTTGLDGHHRSVMADATGGAISLNLPAAANAKGRIYRLKKIDASGNAVTVDGDGSETIDGATTYVLSAQYDQVTVQSDGTQWWVI